MSEGKRSIELDEVEKRLVVEALKFWYRSFPDQRADRLADEVAKQWGEQEPVDGWEVTNLDWLKVRRVGGVLTSAMTTKDPRAPGFVESLGPELAKRGVRLVPEGEWTVVFYERGEHVEGAAFVHALAQVVLEVRAWTMLPLIPGIADLLVDRGWPRSVRVHRSYMVREPTRRAEVVAGISAELAKVGLAFDPASKWQVSDEDEEHKVVSSKKV